jgi:hypothetical protein
VAAVIVARRRHTMPASLSAAASPSIGSPIARAAWRHTLNSWIAAFSSRQAVTKA